MPTTAVTATVRSIRARAECGAGSRCSAARARRHLLRAANATAKPAHRRRRARARGATTRPASPSPPAPSVVGVNAAPRSAGCSVAAPTATRVCFRARRPCRRAVMHRRGPPRPPKSRVPIVTDPMHRASTAEYRRRRRHRRGDRRAGPVGASDAWRSVRGIRARSASYPLHRRRSSRAAQYSSFRPGAGSCRLVVVVAAVTENSCGV